MTPMNVVTTHKSLADQQADAVVIGIWNESQLSGTAAELDRITAGRLTHLITSGWVSTDCLDMTELLALPELDGIGCVLLIGLGKREESANGQAFQVAAAAARKLASKKRHAVVFMLDDLAEEQAVAGSVVGCAGQDIYRTEKKLHPFNTVKWAAAEATVVENGRILGESINLTRRLVNQPADEIYPESFAQQCHNLGDQHGFQVEIWDEQRLQKENCRALLAVGRGSERPPRLVIMKYQGADQDAAPTTWPLALVGKGVTFDSGGLSLKPSEGMLDMKGDMAGAATVLGGLCAIARLKLPVNVIALVGLAENLISGRAYKLGDVLTARSGKTIEVHNTDAEGRLVLADTLDVAVDQGAQRLLDLATLTGACMVALGRQVAGIFSNDQPWCNDVAAAAQTTGEPAWQLPMFKEYGQDILSNVADIKNVGDGRWGGAITAAKFLEEFVRQTPWVHVDIAGPAFSEKPPVWIDGGASGYFVRSLVELTKQLASRQA